MKMNTKIFVLIFLLFVAIYGTQESERCSEAQDNPMLKFQQEPQCTARRKTDDKARRVQDSMIQEKSLDVVENPQDAARHRQDSSNCESHNWDPEAAIRTGAIRSKATQGTQKQPRDTTEHVIACKTSQEPTDSAQDGPEVTLLAQESLDNSQRTSQDSLRRNLECIQQGQSGYISDEGPSPKCGAARQTPRQEIRRNKPIIERSGRDGEMTKETRMRERMETQFLNRSRVSRPIAWVDDYNVSYSVKM